MFSYRCWYGLLCFVAEFHRKGSVVVDYRVAVPEDIANPGNTIVNAIKEESGGWKFGEFEVDVNSIKAESKSVL